MRQSEFIMDHKQKEKLLEKITYKLSRQLSPYGYTGYLLPFLEPKRAQLEDIIKRTAVMGESNSVLIMGPPGSGKSALLESALQNVLKSTAVRENMTVVSLNGLTHFNDNVAFDDITKQLDLRPDADRNFGNASEKLRVILATFKKGGRESRSVLFVLDKFELFCAHKNQNLLYNLFNSVQMREVPLCIVGLTSYPDQLQALENRVSSRFSHQKIEIFDKITYDMYSDAAAKFLTIEGLSDRDFQKVWNATTKALMASSKNDFLRQYQNSTSMRDLKRILLPLLNKGLESVRSGTKIEADTDSQPPDTLASLIQGLSVLEVAILLAMVHLSEIWDGEPVNFELVFNEVGRFLTKRLHWNVDKNVVMKAFEHLLELEMVKKMSGDCQTSIKRYMPVKLLVPADEVRGALKCYPKLPAPLKHWAESSIDG